MERQEASTGGWHWAGDIGKSDEGFLGRALRSDKAPILEYRFTLWRLIRSACQTGGATECAEATTYHLSFCTEFIHGRFLPLTRPDPAGGGLRRAVGWLAFYVSGIPNIFKPLPYLDPVKRRLRKTVERLEVAVSDDAASADAVEAAVSQLLSEAGRAIDDLLDASRHPFRD